MQQQIAIDGTAASGKGTIARGLAQALNFAYLDTGLLYRAVAQALLQNPEADAIAVARALTPQDLQDKTLRQPEVAQKASEVAAHPAVRTALLAFQRHFADHPPDNKAGAILDGRDIATVILPDAPCKIFITANLDTRAERRLADLATQAKTALPSLAEVRTTLEARDKRDQTRTTAPLRQAPDALLLDTSTQTIAESRTKALAHARQCLNLRP